jgi:hypothetical protein
MKFDTDRRGALIGLGTGLVLTGLTQGGAANAAAGPTLEPAGAKGLQELTQALAAMGRRRDYKTRPKQAWDNTDLTGPWLNVMRNSLNSQIWGFRQPDFLCVSATHGPAHLALYDQETWDKYQLAKIAGGNVARNTFIIAPPAATHDPADFQSMEGAFSPKSNSVTVLQQRGVVFMACSNAIWELAARLHAAGQNPDNLPVGGIAAELANHLIPDAVLTPGAVATLVNLQQAGFTYTR